MQEMQENNNRMEENAALTPPTSAAQGKPITQHVWQNQPQQQGFSTATPPQKHRRVFAAADRLFVWLSIAMGYLFIAALPLGKTPLGSMLALMLLFSFGGIYLRLSGIRPPLRATVLAVIFALFSIPLITTANATIRFFSWALTTAGFLFFLGDAAGLCGKGLLSNHLLTYAKRSVLSAPSTGFASFFPALLAGREGEKGNRAARVLGWIALGLLMALIPTIIVVALLSYDDQFTKLLRETLKKIRLWEVLRDLILGFGVAIPLFGALYHTKAKNACAKQEELPASRLGVLPRPLLCAAVTPILLVYVLFFFSQKSYYLSALTHVLPSDLTYAAYARNGFFELCWVCGINAALLLFFNLFIKRTEGGKNLIKRIYSAIISVFTLILIVTALSKMILYIDFYGLTQKRVYASWFICLLGFVFLAVLLRQILPRFPLIPTAVIGALLFWAIIAFPNTDAVIAHYNVDAYLQGDLQEMDVEALEELGVSSVPALIELEQALSDRTDLTESQANALTEAGAALSRAEAELKKEEGLLAWNLPNAYAKKLLAQRKESSSDT